MADSSLAAAAAASLLTDDLIVEIFSRLPVRSVHRCKCVCKLWRDLIAQPAHRKKLPQTLAGFLYSTWLRPDFISFPGAYRHHLAGVSASAVDFEIDASLDFLQPMNYAKIRLLETCNGLLLCSCYKDTKEERLVVCNPATRRWTELPPPPQPQPATEYVDQRLAFDPALSTSHFHVLYFEVITKGCHVKGVSIYSSITGAWTHRDIELPDKIMLSSGSVFAGGMLYLPASLGKYGRHGFLDDDDSVLLIVDMEWKAWKTVRAPRGNYCGAIGLSQGCLYYATRPLYRVTDSDDDAEHARRATVIQVWCLEDYGSQKWALKHSVRIDKLLNLIEMDYHVAGFHPDRDTIFFDIRGVFDGDSFEDSSLASWDMRRREFRTVLDLEKGCTVNFLPYVPMFSDSTLLADGDVHYLAS